MSVKWFFLGAVLVLSACATNESKKEMPPPVVVASAVPPPKPESRASQIGNEADLSGGSITAVERRFAEGLTKYDEGNFVESIRIFKESSFERAWPELRLRALKYLAFSYCVSGNPAPCKKTFVEILRIEPSFDLASAERGHPLWGPVFQEAKIEVDKPIK